MRLSGAHRPGDPSSDRLGASRVPSDASCRARLRTRTSPFGPVPT